VREQTTSTMVVTLTVGMVVVTTSLSRTQSVDAVSVGIAIAELVLLPSTYVPVFDVVMGLIL
jgi:hypothetical protein